MTGSCVVTIGTFDGVHRGHAHVLELARSLSDDLTDDLPLPVVAVTFDPLPLSVVAPDRVPRQLTSLESRIRLLTAAGADSVYVLAFSREMASWSPDEFVEHVLVDQTQAAGVVVGENFRFGHKAAGDVDFLRAAGERLGFVVEGLVLDGGDTPWSSTMVRNLLAAGDVAEAAAVLGRLHEVSGVVVEGDRRGRQLGFPTANIPAPDWLAIPVDGIYAGWLTAAGGARMPAAISVGSNPTFDGVDRRVESYVLDRDDLELYGLEVTVEFAAWIRDQVMFDGADDLVAAVRDDVRAARRLLG